MTNRQHLLPSNATPLERAVSETLDRDPVLGPGIDAASSIRFQRPLIPSYAAWILAQYGLGGVSQFFDTIEEAIDAGVPWQRVRGTVAALELALDWIGYDEIAVEHLGRRRRRKWNRYQIGMGSIPEMERPILLDAEYLADASDPARGVFFRGWHGYDARALEWSRGRWGSFIWNDDSGARLDGGKTKWSHGESHSGAIVAGETERQALGIDVAEGQEVGWGDFPWEAPGVSWEGITDVAAFKSFLLRRLPILVGFYREDGSAIGYRRPFVVRDVTAEHEPGEDAIVVEIECRTGFGDGEGEDCDHCALVFRGRNSQKPGRLWNVPGELSFEDGVDPTDVTIGAVPLGFTFRRTVRQHVTLTLEI